MNISNPSDFDEESTGEVQECIEEPIGIEKWEDEPFTEYEPDDLEEYNRNEADDYRNEGNDDAGEDTLEDNESSDVPEQSTDFDEE